MFITLIFPPCIKSKYYLKKTTSNNEMLHGAKRIGCTVWIKISFKILSILWWCSILGEELFFYLEAQQVTLCQKARVSIIDLPFFSFQCPSQQIFISTFEMKKDASPIHHRVFSVYPSKTLLNLVGIQRTMRFVISQNLWTPVNDVKSLE